MGDHFDDAVPDELGLIKLVMAYAQLADDHDGEAFAGLFSEDGVLEMPGERFATRAALAAIPGRLRARYFATFHQVASWRFVRGPEGATGKVRAVAHHVARRDDGSMSDRILHLAYDDDYAPGETWRFRVRRMTILWSESRLVGLGRS